MDAKCRLLALPAELRLRIYELALAPTGVLTLTSSKTKRFAVLPTIAPTLLATCKQIHREANTILYAQNEIAILVDAHDTCYPLLPENRLPPRVISRFVHVFLVLECTAFFSASYADVDFEPFGGFSALQSIRFCVIRDARRNSIPASSFQHRVQLFAHLLAYLPKTMDLQCHIDVGSQQQEFVDTILRMRRTGRADSEAVIQVPGAEIKAAIADAATSPHSQEV